MYFSIVSDDSNLNLSSSYIDKLCTFIDSKITRFDLNKFLKVVIFVKLTGHSATILACEPKPIILSQDKSTELAMNDLVKVFALTWFLNLIQFFILLIIALGSLSEAPETLISTNYANCIMHCMNRDSSNLNCFLYLSPLARFVSFISSSVVATPLKDRRVDGELYRSCSALLNPQDCLSAALSRPSISTDGLIVLVCQLEEIFGCVTIDANE